MTGQEAAGRAAGSGPGDPAPPVLFYDGGCALCHRLVRTVLRLDRAGTFRFAPLEGRLAAAVLSRHRRTTTRDDTAYLWLTDRDGAEILLDRSNAALEVLRRLGGVPAILARIAACLSHPLCDRVYDLVAARRRRWFGTLEGCPLPAPDQRSRFLE
jgi:predicted DCC family thiol-disulfide oxidoreductase YuxK